MKSGAAQKYPTLSTDEICHLAVPDMCEKATVLFLWATTPMLPDAMKVLEAWRFKYKTKIVWHKILRKGLGYWFRVETEDLLVAVRGPVRAFRCQLPNFVEHEPGRHSEKPAVFRELIETATANMQNRAKIELFCRGLPAPSWTGWGNEALPAPPTTINEGQICK